MNDFVVGVIAGVAKGIMDKAYAAEDAIRGLTGNTLLAASLGAARSLSDSLRIPVSAATYGSTTNNIGGDTFNIYAEKLSPAEMLAEAQYTRERRAMTLVPA